MLPQLPFSQCGAVSFLGRGGVVGGGSAKSSESHLKRPPLYSLCSLSL